MPGRHSIKTPPHHATWGEFLDVWKEADQIDVFESAWNWDHFYPLAPPYDGPNLEGWTMLGALAQATSRIRIGAMVNGMHHRHPAVTANMAARWSSPTVGSSWAWARAGTSWSPTPTASRSASCATAPTGSRKAWRSSSGCLPRRP